MENKDENMNLIIPLIAFERMQYKEERKDRLQNAVIVIMAIVIIVIAVLHFISEAQWRRAWSEYDYVATDELSVDLQADEGGDANYIGNDGDITYGEDNGNTQENEIENTSERQ